MKTLKSNVFGYKGLCKPTWINHNQVCHMLDQGVTGFFRLVEKRWWGYKKVGKEFHGIIKNGEVETTMDKEAMIADDLGKTL